mmetsp:Transcript_28957/g.46491  ORF Transcript_28957/g.46491 Transcript_28957/m.46491 type:complete len:82 (+) Transcript_28957:50-295(+)
MPTTRSSDDDRQGSPCHERNIQRTDDITETMGVESVVSRGYQMVCWRRTKKMTYGTDELSILPKARHRLRKWKRRNSKRKS